MQHRKARQRESDGRFDYTVADRHGVSPEGYCHAYRPWTDEQVRIIFGGDEAEVTAQREKLEAETAPFREKYHDDGHATVAEAEECYRTYLLDQRLRLDGKMTNQMLQCQVCGAFTQGLATVGGSRSYVLCDPHRTRAWVSGLVGVGESWSS